MTVERLRRYVARSRKRYTLYREIRKLRSAMLRVHRELEDLEAPFEFPRDCCPGCACGPDWHQLVEKLERQEAWLKQLTRKMEKA